MNPQRSRAALLVGLLALCSATALADEQAITLKNGPGRDVVEGNCGLCHSLDYIEMNAPFPDEKLWRAEVAKMINVFGAPVEPDRVETIVDYLVSNYGSAKPVAPAGPASSTMGQRPGSQERITPTETGTPGSATSIGRGTGAGNSDLGLGREGSKPAKNTGPSAPK